MDGIVYGCLVIQGRTQSGVCLLPLDLERSNHLTKFDLEKPNTFDYWHGGVDTEKARMHMPARRISFTAYSTGEKSTESKARYAIQSLIMMNTRASEEEKDNSYLDLVRSKVLNTLKNRQLVSVDVVSSQPKFVVMTKDVPVYFLVCWDAEAMYLVWTNETTFETRLKSQQANRFVFYRMRPVSNGAIVIQSHFLRNKLNKWRQSSTDNLRIMNYLEAYLFRGLEDTDSKVNAVNDDASVDAGSVLSTNGE